MTWRKRSLPASGLWAILLGLVIVSHGMPASAEILPTEGTFRGIYHVNRAGVARFNSFIIAKDLRKEMAPYEGKYIELEVVKGRQPFNPGPAVVDQIGKVTRLPNPPFSLKLWAEPSTANTQKTIDVIYSVENVGKEEITIDANYLRVGVRSYSQSVNDDTPDEFLHTGYSRRQLSFDGTMLQRWNFLSPMHPGKSTHFYTRQVLLRPGEAAPFVLHSIDLKPGHYELTVAGSYYRKKDGWIPVMAASSLDMPLLKPKETQERLVDARAKVTYEDEWLVVDGRITARPEAEVALFTLSDGQRYFLPGLAQLYSDSGDLLPARLDWQQPDGPWRQTNVNQEGLPFKFRIRHTDHFSRTHIKRIGFWTVTRNGIERLTLADGLPERPQPPLPPWGKDAQGCRLRIQMPRKSLRVGEKIRFFFQAESDGKTADMVGINEGGFAKQVIVTIDGNKTPIGTIGTTDGQVNRFPRFPFQGEVSLPDLHMLAPGKHTLQASVRGDPGIYTNLRGEKFRKLNGTLVSNTVEFEVHGDE